jgi:hypothetical protein
VHGHARFAVPPDGIFSTVTSVSACTVYVVPSANVMRAAPSPPVWIKSPLSSAMR